MILVERYSPSVKDQWNNFVASSKNGSFLFMRDYMEYHADRFPDYSFLAYQDGLLIAVFPCTLQGDVASSHAGLTFGGIVSDEHMSTAAMLQIFDALLRRLREEKIRKLLYKPAPRFYHVIPAEEDLYALFRYGARLCRRDVGSVLSPGCHPELSKMRKRAVGKAQKSGVSITESRDFARF